MSEKRLNSRLERLLTIFPKLGAIVDEQQVINETVEITQKLFDADHVHIRVINWETENLELKGYYSKEDKFDYLFKENPYYEFINYKLGMIGKVFQTKKSIEPINRKSEIESDPRFKEYKKFLNQELETMKEKLNFFSTDNYHFVRYCFNFEILVKLFNLIEHLKNVESVMIAPLLLENKAIGVLNAYRIDNPPKREKFNKDDLIILEHFANQVAIALYSSWLFESTMWNPQEKFKETINVELLSELVIKEAKRLTGANDAKIRFLDWRTNYLVPGFLSDEIPNKIDRKVLVREKGLCPAGKTAETEIPFISKKDLQNVISFKEFRYCAKSYSKSYKLQLNLLRAIKKCGTPLSFFYIRHIFLKPIEECTNLCPKISEDMEKMLIKRLEILYELYYESEEKYRYSLEKQIISLDDLIKSWDNYINTEIDIWHSEIVVPIKFGESLLGVLNVHSKENEWFTQGDFEILQALSGRVAISIMDYQSKIFSELQEIEQKMTANQNYFDFAKRLTEGVKSAAFLINNPKKIYPLLYICNPIKPENLLQKDDINKYFKFQPRSDIIAEEIKLANIPFVYGGLGYRAIKKLEEELKKPEKLRGSVFAVRENVDDPVSGSMREEIDLEVKTNVCLPLFFGEYVYGLLYVDIKERYFFTELEKNSLNLFSMKAGTILRNLRGYPEELFSEFSEAVPGIKCTYDELFGAELIQKTINLR